MKKTVLIVEDELPILQALEDKLRLAGHHVLKAKNGKNGLTIAFEKKPDIILLDILIPSLDGMSMMGSLRNDTWGKKVPIIFLTNLGNDKILQKLIKKNNAYFYIKAETKITDIIDKVNEILSN